MTTLAGRGTCGMVSIMTYYEWLLEKGVFLRETFTPNPIVRTDGGVWVLVEFRDRTERCRFLVDEPDYNTLVRPYRWNVGSVKYNRAYTSAFIEGHGNSTVLLARWLINPPHGVEVDHVNLNPLDNRRENLRLATRKQNEENRPAESRQGRSQHRGVFWDSGRWRAQVTHNYVAHKSPRFTREEDAAEWARQKRAELFTHVETA